MTDPNSVPHRRRLVPTLVLGLGTALTAVSCSGGGSSGATGSTTTTTEATTTTSTTSRPGPLDDQKPPQSVHGLAFHDDKLWLADADAGQVLAVDPATGEILVRWKGQDGVTRGVEDLAVGTDGTVYWTGYDDGSVSKMTPANVQLIIAGLKPGVSAIAFSAKPIAVTEPRDAALGRLYVDRTGDGDGLWEIDPTGERQPREVAASIGEVHGFDVGPDGFLYAVREGTGPGGGSLVKVSPVDGSITEIAKGFDRPRSAKFAPDGRTIYVLSSEPPAVMAVDIATGATTRVGTPKAAAVDGMAVAPDGRIFVSAPGEPVITVLRPDGSSSSVRIGR